MAGVGAAIGAMAAQAGMNTAGGILNTLVQAGINKRVTERNQDYFSPSNIMERYQEAGINPITAVSDGSFTQSAQSQSYQAPQFNVNPIDLVGILSQLQSVENNTRLTNAEIQLKASQALKNGVSSQLDEYTLLNLLPLKQSIMNYQGNLSKLEYDRLNDLYSKVFQGSEQEDWKFYTYNDLVIDKMFNENRKNLEDAKTKSIFNSYARDYYTQRNKSLDINNQIRNIDLENYQLGISPSSPWYTKFAASILNMLLKEFNIK